MTVMSTYFPFLGGPAAAEADWGLFAVLWAPDGVMKGMDNEFSVLPTGTPDLNVHVSTGGVWAQGYFGRKGSITDFAITPDVTNPRKDLVVARANFSTHLWEILYRTGTPAGSPAPPTSTRIAGTTWDIALAEISVPANATSIPAGNITDRRPWTTTGVVRAAPVASASPLVIPNVDQVGQGWITVVPVTGTVSFNNITGPSGGSPLLILEFSGVLGVTTNTGNIRLGRNLVTQAGTTLALYWDAAGAVWREIARSQEVVSGNTFLAGPTSGGGLISARALVQDDFPAALWSTLNLTAGDQTGAIVFTPNYGRLLKMGKFFCYISKGTVLSNAGASGTTITITLPFAYQGSADMSLGEFHYFRSAASTRFFGQCIAVNPAAGTMVLYTQQYSPAETLTRGFTLGNLPSFLAAAGDVLWLIVRGELP